MNAPEKKVELEAHETRKVDKASEDGAALSFSGKYAGQLGYCAEFGFWLIKAICREILIARARRRIRMALAVPTTQTASTIHMAGTGARTATSPPITHTLPTHQGCMTAMATTAAN